MGSAPEQVVPEQIVLCATKPFVREPFLRACSLFLAGTVLSSSLPARAPTHFTSIKPEECRFEILKTKIEITMMKADGTHWVSAVGVLVGPGQLVCKFQGNRQPQGSCPGTGLCHKKLSVKAFGGKA
eukprot:1153770-Pelagomonas_calceolata.AAC.10